MSSRLRTAVSSIPFLLSRRSYVCAPYPPGVTLTVRQDTGIFGIGSCGGAEGEFASAGELIADETFADIDGSGARECLPPRESQFFLCHCVSSRLRTAVSSIPFLLSRRSYVCAPYPPGPVTVPGGTDAVPARGRPIGNRPSFPPADAATRSETRSQAD
ncbi:hypothetical protein DJ79_15300 [Halorubrum ezzemoulense]|uniref:Uncharacterized protein n=1 Tax=Halorubrum ezzemoulense TaxID=337243 RepID=A0A256JA49_HALEZ|nr:hypothetical protein DJ79_15300 [Halorubrum ezzemoulense]